MRTTLPASSPAIRILRASDAAAVSALLDRRPARDAALTERVADIVAAVRRAGDEALFDYARRFDGLEGPVEVPREEMRDAADSLAKPVRAALAAAARNIRHVAKRQVPKSWKTSPVRGVAIEQRVLPLDRVGCYVPAGRFPLPSSLLMSALPAAVAGVPEIIAV